jgi:uncharacterized membrane protein YedE/YeeE
MKSTAVAFACGLIFALGLGLGEMTDPNRILGFLDLFGHWDPTLVFVMIGAIAVHLPVRRLGRRPGAPGQPDSSRIDARLVTGAALFGVGWGLSGYCPGPALVSLVTAGAGVLLFVAAMIAGILLHRLTTR